MKKLATLIAGAVLALLVLAGCGGGTELIISIGDGNVENDSVSVQLKYGDTWENDTKIFDVNYGHESQAVLADEYYIALCEKDPLFENGLTLHNIFIIKKADLEGRTVSGGKFSGKPSGVSVPELTDVLPAGEGTLSVYIVLYSTDTDFSDITSFASHEITFEWDGETVRITG